MERRDDTYIVRPLAASEWADYRDARLRSLADSPDAFGSTLADEQARSDEAWAERLARAAASGVDCPLAAARGGAVIGLLWAKQDAADPGVVNLFQMWVAPESRGRGVAAALLRAATGWAGARGANVVQLGVTCGDSAAVRLYLRAGFKEYGVPEPLRPGSLLLSQTMRLALG